MNNYSILEILDSVLYDNYMKAYYSHLSAAKMWNIPCVEAVLGDKFGENSTTHITVSKNNARLNRSGKVYHSCELTLPPEAVLVRKGITVASPELLFLEFASELDLHRLILLGLQLCSHPPGCPSAAITTTQKINSFLARIAGHKGQSKAIRAMKYVKNGSASIMESLVYMVLSLPNALGGYGLNGAVFNHEIVLKSEMQHRLGRHRCFTDLYYKHACLAIEYDSFAYHNKPSEQGKDSIRAAVLERQGIDIMRMSTIQLYDENACRDFAYNLAARVGKRIQIRTNKFGQMHALLRQLLPEKTETVQP
jgi:hypothetical protein